MMKTAPFKDPDDLIPAIIQDAESHEVLMLAYMNQEAYDATLRTGLVHFYSRSRQKLWQKGETSGHVLSLKDLSFDCDQDTLLIQARPKGPTCHEGTRTCFKDSKRSEIQFLRQLEEIMEERIQDRSKGSYTHRIYSGPKERLYQKLGEEAVEALIAFMKNDREEVVEEVSDLIYHLLLSLRSQNLRLSDIARNLESRHFRSEALKSAQLSADG